MYSLVFDNDYVHLVQDEPQNHNTWDANAIEQRIGRLDRMGRESDRPIVSVVPYAEETLEEELFKFWDNGLKLFNHSLSGLEIIMNDINTAIVTAIIKDFRFGLTNEIQNVIDRSAKLKEEVREEQHFDTAAYIYRPMNQELISLVKYYNRNENKMFADAMLQWAMLSGLRKLLLQNSSRCLHRLISGLKSGVTHYDANHVTCSLKLKVIQTRIVK